MINFITKIINTGVRKDLEPDLAKRIRVINTMSIVGTLIGLVAFCYSISSNWSNHAILSIALIIPSQILPIVFNAFHKYLLARVYLILFDDLYLVFLILLFGLEMHFQYWLIVIIGLPLFFFNKEIGFFKWVLSLFAIVCWLYVEWHYTLFDPVFSIETSSIYSVRLINDFITFVTVFIMCCVFVKESEIQVNEIENQAAALAKANAKLEQFSYIVSHDLKAPLRTIASYVDIIEADYGQEFNQELSGLFSTVKAGANRMNGLVSSILEYSSAGEGSYENTSFPLTKLLGEVVELIDVPENFTLSYDNNLPTIHGSYVQLEQVLANLIGNAIKYHDKDKGLIEVKVSPQNTGFLKIEVSDDGPGIKPKYQSKVFEMFGSANEVSRVDSTGIGLAIVSKLVELNQGQIGLESEYGAGSNFWFTWPLSVDQLK